MGQTYYHCTPPPLLTLYLCLCQLLFSGKLLVLIFFPCCPEMFRAKRSVISGHCHIHAAPQIGGKVFFQCTCKVMQTVFVRGLSHCPFAVEVADLSRLFVQFFCFFTLLWLTMNAENILEENFVTHSNLASEITILIGLSRPHLKKRAGVIVLFLRLYVSKSHPDQPFHIVLNLFLYMFLNGFPFNQGLIQSRLSL